MRKLPIALAVFAALAVPVAAYADSYNYVISTSSSTFGSPAAFFLASGTLSGTPSSTVPGALNLTGVTGDAQNYFFTGIAPVGSVTGLTYDDLLYTGQGGRYVDGKGILLYLSSPAGVSLAHVYDNNGYFVDVFDPNDPADKTAFTLSIFNVNPVPEPGTLALMGTGLLGFVGAARRRLTR